MLLSLEVDDLQEATQRSVAAIMHRYTRAKRIKLGAGFRALNSVVANACEGMLFPLVDTAYMQSALGKVRERISSKGKETSCLGAFHHDPVKLASGADGTVYRLGDKVVAKVGKVHKNHHGHIPNANAEQANLEIEMARTAGAHGLSPRVHDTFFCASDDTFYYVIVMDMVKGELLDDWESRATPRQAKAMHAKVTRALDKLYALGIEHNDLHAGNVMVREDGSPVIIDYSRARRANAPVTADRESAARIFERLPWTVSELTTLVVGDLLAKGVLKVGAQGKK
jgi:predicted Ser/Thr protein kinase